MTKALTSDVVVVGAGIVGLAHAAEAVRRGLSVQVVERDAAAVGASVRNFGHACVTAQVGALRELAESSREGWLDTVSRAGFWAREAGAYVVARAADEMGVLEEFAAAEAGDVELLTGDEAARRIGRGTGDPLLGAAFLPRDLRVDPRTTVADLAAYLESTGVRFHWRHCVTGVGPGVVSTSRGEVRGDRIVVAVGHDLDHLFPTLADAHHLRRCRLSMALVEAPSLTTDAAVLTATSMLRYDGMARTTAARRVQARLTQERPELLDVAANVMMTRRPDGSVIVGDSHHDDVTTPPFLDEDVTDALLAEAGRVLGGPVRVRQRWQGVYASSPRTPLIRATPVPGVDVVTVSTGLGMTLSFGLARETFARG